jgi:hypothetical protein
MIEAYQFGAIKVSGKTYHSDVIIYPDHVDSQWWRKQGHSLDIKDIKEVISSRPEVIIVGTGRPGLMQVSEATLAEIRKLNIEAVVMPTEQACREYNRIASEKKVVACLHLTC